MDKKTAPEGAARLLKKLAKNKFILAALILGLALLLIPSGGGKAEEKAASGPVFSLAEEEKRIRDALAAMAGVGKTAVVLTLKATAERSIARDGERLEPVTVQTGSGTQDAVTLRYLYPEYRGALIVCEGGGSSAVRLAVTEAVAALTGLGADKITVIKMEK